MSKTLVQIIAAHEAHRATQAAPMTALTPLGAATRSVYQLRRQMAALEPAERAEVLGLVVAELEILPHPAPQPVEPAVTV